MIAVFDSCIVIDYLNGIESAERELRRYERVAINPITWVEVQVKAPAGLEEATRQVLSSQFDLLSLDMPELDEALRLRRERRIKLPDALIWASARVRGWTLVTRDTKAFADGEPGIRVPYAV